MATREREKTVQFHCLILLCLAATGMLKHMHVLIRVIHKNYAR